MAAIVVFRDAPVTWTMLQSIITQERIPELGRSREILAKYAEHMSKVKQEYLSTKDYVLIRFLGFPFEEVDASETEPASKNEQPRTNNDTPNIPSNAQLPSSKTTRKKRAVTDQPPQESVRLFPNDFPYYFENGIDHLILWSQKVLSSDQIDSLLKPLLKKRYGDEKIEVLTFKNPVAMMSIREVPHIHVCVRRAVSSA